MGWSRAGREAPELEHRRVDGISAPPRVGVRPASARRARRTPSALVLGVTATLVALALTRAGVVAPPPTGQSPAPLEITLLTAEVRWRAPAGALASFALWRQGVRIAATQATAAGDGRVAARFTSEAGPVVVESGDQVAVRAGDAISFTRTAPLLAADVDPAARRVSGAAPAGAYVELEAFDPAGARVDAAIERAGADGGYGRTLPSGIALVAGVWGQAIVTTAQGDRFAARWDVPAVEATLGSPRVMGRATLGRIVRGDGAGLDGQRAASAAWRVVGASSFTLTLEAGGAARPVTIGDVVRLEIDGRPALTGTAPALTALVDGRANRVSGRGPPNTALYAVVHAAGGEHGLPAITDAAGGYRVDFDGVVDIGRDTPVFVSLTRERVTFRAPGFRESVTATLGSATLAGVAVPGTWVTANLTRRDATGERRAFGDAEADHRGVFGLTLRESEAGPALAVAPGDRIVTAFGTGGEPRTLVVPNFAAAADPVADAVSGMALPYTQVDVVVDGRPGTRRTVQADQTGGFSCDYRSVHDILPGTTGTAAMTLDGDDAVVVPWAAPRIDLELGVAAVAGRAAAGSGVNLVLYRGGQATARGDAVAAGTAGAAVGAWRVELRDVNGEPVAPAAGDRLVAAIGGWNGSIPVPPLGIEANPATDAVRGTGTARTDLAVAIERGGEAHSAAVTTGPDGAFALDLVGDWDVRPDDALAVTATLAHGTATARARVPRLTFDLDTGSVTGFAHPFSLVGAELHAAGGAVRASGSTAADAFGRFEVGLVDGGGAVVAPAAGDDLAVTADGGTSTAAVPPAAVSIDPDGDWVWVAAPVGAAVSATAVNTLGGWRSTATLSGRAGPDGRFGASFGEDLDVAAGTLARAVVEPADGRAYRIERREPLVGAQHGGNLVAGYAGAGSDVRLAVTRAGAAVGGQATEAQADGAFVGLVVDAAGRPVALRPGDAIRASWSGGAPRYLSPAGDLGMVVAPVTATLGVVARRIEGTAPLGATVFAGPSATGGTGPTRRLAVDGMGRFGADLAGEAGPDGLEAGRAWDVVALDAAGQRTFVTVVAPYLEATLHDSRVVGRAAPLAGARLALSAGGRVVAQAVGTGDTFGHFGATLRDPGRTLRGVEAGDTLALREPSGAETTLLVPALSIAIDRVGDRLHGAAPAGAAVGLRLRAPGRPDANVQARADASGMWRIEGRDLPAGWRLADVTGAEARLTVSNGHTVRAVPVSPPTATPSPTPTGVTATATGQATPTPRDTPDASPTPSPAGTVWLPVVVRAARVGGRR